jgi:DNA-binding CsgD family transcriptional regulator
MHLRAAHLLDEAGAPAEQVAAHLLLVSRRGDPWAADRLLAAAEGALARGAPEIAVRCLRRALEEPPEEGGRARVLTELALVESQVDLPSSVERLRAAQRVQEDPLARLRIVRTLVFTLIFTGRTDEAVAAATAALRDADPDHEDAAAWVEAFRLVAANFGATAPGTAERLAALRKRPVPEHPGGRARAALSGLDWTVRTGPRAECVAIARSALRDGAVYGHPEGYTLSVGAKLVLEMAEDVAAADAVWQAALDEAHRTGSLFALSTIHLWHGKSLMDRGDLEAARERLDSAGELLELWGIGANTWSMGFLTAAAVGQGRVAEAAELERRIVYDADTSDGSIWALHAIAALRLAEGDHPAALLVTDDIGRRLTLRGIRERLNPAWFPYRALAAQALAGLGRTEEARTLAGEDLALAREWGAPGPIGRALRILGEIEEGAGADGRGLLAEAVATLEGSSRRLELATALASHGAALRRARRPTEAREPLRRALEMAEACGAANLVGHTRTELHATGARPRATARSGPGALTPSERRVVGMAARGETNRDIAQSLFVTPKTVELHLSNAYRKLGVRSRRELPEALAAAS